MSKVVRLADWRARHRPVFFDRNELNQLLAVYSRRVAKGEWRDYAINQGDGVAVFSVFRHAHTRPLFSIAKYAPGQRAKGDYMLLSGGKRLKQGRTLRSVLSELRRHNLTLVASLA